MTSAGYIYHEYDHPDPPHQPLYLQLVVQYLNLSKAHLKGRPPRVLDAGCGDGNFTASLSEAGFIMHGLDLSEGGIAKAKVRYPQISFVEASVYDDLLAAYDVSAFDAIVAVEVIEHLYSPRSFINAAYAALAPGGLLIITTPYWGYLKNIMLAVTNRTDRALTALWEGGHIKHWSRKTLRALFETAGFEFIAFHGVGRLPYLWSGMLMVGRKPLDAHS